ncbi:hypothetical protein DFH07DRAFT_776687 [Mycena maculata]|uniref:WD40 repeat-like protein n=1 Tax=Mycena maculata TaxID=230809 RepID=A0AAD7N4S6_9AGAR|nr:hypothetical protein DFH07DRAFT_776687 [Mycena maculata]
MFVPPHSPPMRHKLYLDLSTNQFTFGTPSPAADTGRAFGSDLFCSILPRWRTDCIRKQGENWRKLIRLWDTVDGTQLQIVSGSTDGTVRTWNTATGTQLESIALLQKSTRSSTFAHHSEIRIALPTVTVLFQALDPLTFGMLVRAPHSQPGDPSVFVPLYSSPTAPKFCPDLGINLFRFGISALRTLDVHMDAVNSVGFSPDGTHIVSGSDDSTDHIGDGVTTTSQRPDNLGQIASFFSLCELRDDRKLGLRQQVILIAN